MAIAVAVADLVAEPHRLVTVSTSVESSWLELVSPLFFYFRWLNSFLFTCLTAANCHPRTMQVRTHIWILRKKLELLNKNKFAREIIFMHKNVFAFF